MAKFTRALGSTSVKVRFNILDTASTIGAGKTGLTEATAGLIIATIADVEATTTRYRASSGEIETIPTLGTYSAPTAGKCRFRELDSVNHPGIYELQFADARWNVSGAKLLIITISGASGAAQVHGEIQQDPVPADVQLWKGATAPAMTGDAYARLGAPAGASVSADIAAVKTDTAAIKTDTTAIKAKTDQLTFTGGKVDANATADPVAIRAAIGMGSANMDTQLSTLQADTDNIQTRLPAALISGRMSSQVGAIAANTITAASTSADFNTEIAGAVWDEPLGFHVGTGSAGLTLLSVKNTTDQISFTGGNVNAHCDTSGTSPPLDAAGIRAAIGMASPDLDDQLDSIKADTGSASGDAAAIKAKTNQLTFTVPNVVDANITHVIADMVRQDGSNDTNWGGQP